MRLKFGSSKGLNSGGSSAMQGLGSDSSYRSNGGGSNTNNSGADVSLAVAEVSQKAFSFMSGLVDQVSKVNILQYYFMYF